MSSDITFETFQFCKPHYDVEEFGCAMGRVAGLVSEQSDITFDIVEFGCPMGSVATSVTSTMGFSFGWILLNVGTVPKILRYLIKVSTLLSKVRFSASFRRLEESTHYGKR